MQNDNLAQSEILKSYKTFYEAWYFKFNWQEGAFWVRFLLLQNGEWRQNTVWASYFPADFQQKILSTKWDQQYPPRPFEINQDNTFVRIGDNVFQKSASKGCIQANQQIRWDLGFEPDEKFTYHYAPAWLESRLSSRALSPNVNIKFSGKIFINDQQYIVDGAPGVQGHYYGKKYADSWAWAHCNFFAHDDDSVFEIIDVKVGKMLPGFKSAFVQYRGKKWVFHDLKSMFFAKSHYQQDAWIFCCTKGDTTFEIKITADPGRFVDVEYRDVDQSSLICHNTKQASSILTITSRGVVQDQFVSTHTTAFEQVYRT